MERHDERWARRQGEARAWMARNGLYREADEHDACGVGLVASVKGEKSRRVVESAIEALGSVWHRGAVDADGKTGDGAGILIEISREFFSDHVRRTGHEPDGKSHLAVGMMFLPRTDFAGQEACRAIVESEILRMGHYIYGWRQVPVSAEVLGEKANATRPEIEQILLSNATGADEETFERELYVIRRRVENAVARAGVSGFYACSLSCRTVVYKGMMLAEQVGEFYPDLMDERFASSFAIYHQRYSTNTFPQWWLAQPFRTLAHNGEINTLKGNLNWMRSHEIRLASSVFGELAEDIKPVVTLGSSDSAALDSVFELLAQAGRSAPMAKTILVPEAWSKEGAYFPREWKDMYAYCNSIIEPWDGPAALAMTDGRWVVAGMDRNGLRPMRYTLTKDGLLMAGSESGMARVDETEIAEKGALGPGQMVAVDTQAGEMYRDREIKDRLAAAQPFGEWVGRITDLEESLRGLGEERLYGAEELRRRQIAAGYTIEEIETILAPMADDGKEAVASMGDDTPLAVLSGQHRPMSHFFRQNFSQVTNPPIDPLREHRVMSLKTRFGNLKNVLDENSGQAEILTLESPFLTNAGFERMRESFGASAAEIDCTFPRDGGESALGDALERIRGECEEAVRSGAAQIILTDAPQSPQKAPIPMILATSAVHSGLTRIGLRTFCAINVRSAECVDPHYFAILVGSGATTVNPYLALDSIADRVERGLHEGVLEESVGRYREAMNQGLLKIMSKMGISVVSSYRGGLNFEAVGLSRSLVAEYFPGVPSRVSGIGLTGIQRQQLERHEAGWGEAIGLLPVGGFYKARQSGEKHAWTSDNMHMLQSACDTSSTETWMKYSKMTRRGDPVHLRDLLEIRPLGKELRVDEVEAVASIRKRFVTPGMSLGALSPEAHKTLNVAMNRIGARSDSGEGGEDPAHFAQEPNGDNPSAKIKQVASGRFGVTAEYLNRCEELEIKIAQGAKPGEGGQLPGMKVTSLIARLRHSTPGVTLISPPPHHDIYSIEDLAQLIYDLKQINPDARVTVKLVSASGVGTIAAGVAKAKADVILISGHSGGTGASPATSIKFAGLPWEMGLAETHQVLSMNGLRDRVVLRTDGGLRTGHDVVVAAMLGAEEFGIGTAALVAMGCIMVRQCQSNTCPVGVCTQDERLRERFSGSPRKVVNLISFYAYEVKRILASIGARSVSEIIGRTDLLAQVSRGAAHLDDLDLNPLLISMTGADPEAYDRARPRAEVEDTLDAQIIEDAAPFFNDGEKLQLTYSIRNTHRTVGARTSSRIVRKFGMDNDLRPNHLSINLEGSAGQSFGAFAVNGLKLKIMGDANDYVGKGLSGGIISVRPHPTSSLEASENAIIGNTVLYGATAGKLFASGKAGERFCVRNSGAETVVEGCSSNGCEYMTGGTAVILGRIGSNFGAGMTGGMAFVHDPEGEALSFMNLETLVTCAVTVEHWEGKLKSLVEEHFRETRSRLAGRILKSWGSELGNFLQVCPREMLPHLEHPISEEPGLASAG